MHLEAISKKSFAQPAKGGQVSGLGRLFNSSTSLSMRVEDPVSSRGGLKLGPAFLSRLSRREILNQNPIFEAASIKKVTCPE